MHHCDHQINFSSTYVYVAQCSIFYGPANLLHVLKTIYSRKVVLWMIDQGYSETDIVNDILPYTGIILAPDFCERKNPIWTKTVRDFQIQ